MNKKFLSAILFGALMVTSTGTFVSCKDYDDDIENLQGQISANSSAIAELQKLVGNGDYVTSISVNGQNLVVNTKNGSTNVALPECEDNVGSFCTISEEGELLIDGKATGIKVAEGTTEDGEFLPAVEIVDGEWAVLQEDGTYKSTGVAVSSVAVTGDKKTGYTLTIKDANGEATVVKLPTASSTVADVEFMGVTTLSKLDANLAEDDIKQALSVEYAWIEKIWKANYSDGAEITWSAQKDVVKGQVLTTLAPMKQNLIARIESGADASELAFSLKNSKGAQLPISVGTAAQYQGLLSRLSRGAAGLYALSLDNTAAVYAKESDYTDLYKGGLNAMVEDGGFTSNYNLTVTTKTANVAEGKVAKVGGNAKEDTYYEVDLNKDLAIEFDATNSKYVYDYYVEAADATIAGMFGFTANKTNGTFKLTKLADAISIAKFDLNVYKLHINGAVYKETVTIKPLRTIGQDVVYELGNQTIKNSMKLTVDLADMFTALGDDAAIWKNSKLGAKTYATTVKIGNDAATLNEKYIYKNANGPTNDLYSATKLEITFDAVASNAKALSVGKEYTITIVYKDADGDKLNDIKVKFTPVMPALSSYITKREAVWNENTLMAYFAEPATPWAVTDLDPKYDMTTGFTKLGSAETADKTVITLSLDADQKISDKKVVGDGMATMTGTSLQLYKTTIGSTTKFWAYAQELNVKVAATYLDVYSFTDEEIKAAGFKVKVQSALEAGKIVPAEGNVITIPAAAAGEYAKLTADMITGYTYNNQPYSLFMNATSATSIGYKYTYIKGVKFESVDNVLYTIVDTDSDATDGVTETIWDAENKKEVVGYVQINSGQLTNTTTTEIKVTVSDRFGFSKEVKVPVKITVGE